jgi:hypothetical protein
VNETFFIKEELIEKIKNEYSMYMENFGRVDRLNLLRSGNMR